MTENLVDSEGFPRNDIDVYNVRMARNKIISELRDNLAIVVNSLVTSADQRRETSDARNRVQVARAARADAARQRS